MSWRRNVAPANPAGATVICFNDYDSMEIPFIVDVLVDAGIIVALLDSDDAWHDCVEGFFQQYVYGTEHGPTFYITPDVVNEILHRLIQNYRDRTGHDALAQVKIAYADALTDLLNSDALEHIDLSRGVTLNAIQRWAHGNYGAKDAFHTSCQPKMTSCPCGFGSVL